MAEPNAVQHPLVVEFTKNLELYQGFQTSTETLVRNLLRHKNVNVHAITSRTKDPQSLAEKIERKQGKYKSLADITDLVGLRIIVHYGDDVDQVAQIINEQFGLDLDNSIDKRKAAEPDRFGYVSLHSVVEHLDSRQSLPEYERYRGMKCEIQIRTILQHAWAAVEHSLGYKSEVSIPNEVKRRFSILAGLFELSDQEFMTIRNEVEKYKKKVAEELKNNGEIYVNADSISVFVKNDPLVLEVDKAIAEAAKVPLRGFHPDLSETLVAACRYLDMQTISEVSGFLQENKEAVILFGKYIIESDPYGIASKSPVFRGTSLFHQCHYLVASSATEREMTDYFLTLGLGRRHPDEEDVKSNGRFIKAAYDARKIVTNGG